MSREGLEGRIPLRTDPNARDPRLRGRTYAIPFDAVWEAALALARGGLPGWSAFEFDDNLGVIEAQATSRFLRRRVRARLRVGLDANGQTRVDVQLAPRSRAPALGAHHRLVDAFCRALDHSLAPRPGQILDDPARRAVTP